MTFHVEAAGKVFALETRLVPGSSTLGRDFKSKPLSRMALAKLT